MKLKGQRVACLIGDEYEDLEVWYPVLRLREEGAVVDLIGLEANQTCRGKHGYPATAERSIHAVSADDYEALIVPGGWMPDKLRRYPSVLDFVRAFNQQNKVIATICHGPWILISAKILHGRTLTCTPGIMDDVINAGARYVDEEAVRDGNLVSARRPPDLPAFCRLMIEALSQ